jgi:hypothetical protein
MMGIFVSTESNQTGITLKAKLSNSEVYKKEDLQTRLELTNQTNRKIFIYKYAGFNYAEKCLTGYPCVANYSFIIQKKENDKYIDLEKLANIDEVPIYDSLGNSLEKAYDILQPGQSKVEEFNLIGYYRLQQGNYRFRFFCRLPEMNKESPKFINSDWMPFEVKSERVEYMY